MVYICCCVGVAHVPFTWTYRLNGVRLAVAPLPIREYALRLSNPDKVVVFVHIFGAGFIVSANRLAQQGPTNTNQ